MEYYKISCYSLALFVLILEVVTLMLLSLTIENFVLMEKLELDFSGNLCVITGETGAGKSLIVDAIQGIIGGKLSPDQIKTNAKSAYLEACFNINDEIKKILEENGFEEFEETVTLSRNLQKNGSKSRINGQLVNQSLLKQVGELLIDTIGQNENQYLFKTEKHREIVDLMGNKEHFELKQKVKELYYQLNSLKKSYEELKNASIENKRQIDFYKFQLNEIDEVELIQGEDETLKKEREILVHAEELIKNMNMAYYELYSDDGGSINDRLNSVSKLLGDSLKFDSDLEGMYTEIDSIIDQIREIARQIRNHSENIEADPQKLKDVEKRLNQIIRLKNKYGNSIEEILSYADDLRKKVSLVENSEENLNVMEKEIAKLEKEYFHNSDLLSESRKKIADKIEPVIENELSELGMEKTKFKALINSERKYYSENGTDSVEFMISPNPGEPLKSLSKTASGGEASRIMLALKMVLQQGNYVPTLIFDEIDAGISGKTALTVSQKLAKLAKKSQIICITHLPIVAAMAEQHLWIEKNSDNNVTNVGIINLDENNRIEKLAQMSGGKVSTTSIKYAQDIYQNAVTYKKEFNLSYSYSN